MNSRRLQYKQIDFKIFSEFDEEENVFGRRTSRSSCKMLFNLKLVMAVQKLLRLDDIVQNGRVDHLTNILFLKSSD